MQNLSNRLKHFSYNLSIVPKILPVIQGLRNASVCWDICQSGFAALSTLDDGYYGAGMYFTSSAEYAIKFYTSADKKAVMINWILIGNPFPVTESPQSENSLKGKPIKSGYDCHYCVVDSSGLPYDQSDSPAMKKMFDEFVVSQESQVLPAFVLFLE